MSNISWLVLYQGVVVLQRCLSIKLRSDPISTLPLLLLLPPLFTLLPIPLLSSLILNPYWAVFQLWQFSHWYTFSRKSDNHSRRRLLFSFGKLGSDVVTNSLLLVILTLFWSFVRECLDHLCLLTSPFPSSARLGRAWRTELLEGCFALLNSSLFCLLLPSLNYPSSFR